MRVTAVILAAALTLGSCGGGNTSDQARTVPTSSATATPKGIAVPTATPEPEGLAETLTDPKPAVSSAPRELDEILIALDDLPDGWTAEGWITEGESNGEDCLDRAFAPTLGVTGAAFSQSESGPFLSVGAFEPGEAKDVFDSIADLVEECDGETDSDGYTWSLSAVSFPRVGDDTFAVRLDGAGSFPLAVFYTLARVGDVLIFDISVAFMGAVDAELVESTLRIMVDRAT